MYIGQDISVRSERRGGRTPVPADYETLLTTVQLLALHKVEEFGWQLAFVRQPLFEDIVPVVVSPDRQRYAVLEADGEINMDPTITIRH